jgi:hypothetical protein
MPWRGIASASDPLAVDAEPIVDGRDLFASVPAAIRRHFCGRYTAAHLPVRGRLGLDRALSIGNYE